MKRGNIVAVVDDDESVRESLLPLLNAHGFATAQFAAAEDFLSSGSLDRTSCLVLDVAMPGMTGPELQQLLKRRQIELPIIFITARPLAEVRPGLMASGAVSCLSKPFSETEIVGAVRAAIDAAQEGP